MSSVTISATFLDVFSGLQMNNPKTLGVPPLVIWLDLTRPEEELLKGS